MKTNENLKELAYETIKKKIIYCEYLPNSFLSESLLMKEIDASRTPIREALNKLEQEGFISIIPKKGVMVCPLTLSEVNMAFETRILLEPYILENYMEYIRLDALRELKESFLALLNSSADPNDFVVLDDKFHKIITSACTNKYLNISLAHLFDQSMRIRLLAGIHIWKRHTKAAAEHIAIIDAILENNKQAAKEALYLHLNASKEAAVKSLIEQTMPVC